MPKIYSLSSSGEDESEPEIKKETTETFQTNQNSEISGANEDQPKSRSGRVLRSKRVKLQIISEDSETSAEGEDSDYEPEVIVKPKPGKRKAAAAPKNVKKVKTKQTATCSSSPVASKLPRKRKSCETSKVKNVRVKRTRWDCPDDKSELSNVKKEKENFLFGEDSDEVDGCSKKIKTESVGNEFNAPSDTQVKEESRSTYENEVCGKIKSENDNRQTALGTVTAKHSKIKVESDTFTKENDDASSYPSTSEYKIRYDDVAGTSGDIQPETGAKWKAEVERKNHQLKREEKNNLKVQAGVGRKTNEPFWEEARVLAEDLALEYWIAKNITRLLDEDNTIPFIARYRKEMTGNMSPEDLRKVKEAYETLKLVKTKAEALVNTVKKLGKLTDMIENEILSARSMSELEHIKSSFKTAAKGTLADRARELGLETPAVTLLCGNSMDPIRLEQFVCHQKTKGLANCKEVATGLQHIIADIISKDREVQDLIRKLKSTAYIYLCCTKSKTASKASTKKSPKAKKPEEEGKKKKGAAGGQHGKDKEEDETKYQNYFNFKNNVRFIRPHQVLAINRGEKNKILSVKIETAGNVKNDLLSLVHRRWLNHGLNYPLRYQIVQESFEDAYERLIYPLLVRLVRSELTQVAETASVEVFATNLKNLLLQPPFRGKIVMGLDPGFKNGCKLCVISQTGEVLHTDVLYPKFGFRFHSLFEDSEANRLKWIVNTYRCEAIALGNGTACRETEEYLSNLIQLGWFRPFDVVYTIVSEQGASIYSCSPEAQKEFPKMDTNLISAVSIARRLQDPLAELVKIEARHLGVGMYQHDISDAKLRSTLDEVVVECVSFVGVDLNAASHCILRKIAGLNATRAQNILDWKNENGPFRNREQLKHVKGIGAKSFEQCAGFVRILQQTCFIGSDNSKNKGPSVETKGKKSKAKEISSDLNPLDSTWIHPESYSVAERIVRRCGAYLTDIGSPRFIEQMRRAVANIGLKSLSMEMKISDELAKLVTEGLTQPPDHDLRSEFKKPLFRRGVTSLEDLSPGDVLSGIVRNTTHFGAFVDIGVGRDGLLPSARLKNGMSLPQLGDKIEVQIVQVEIQRKRITLDLVIPNH
ncbi:S1 RNA-binding domain-containing protein 1 [Hetaerina americana]|uniref:S1 RNA-binding domain-containing protein 1 n=1 Tax=Hetaerina americana TaxID=62018 RepID=UPI003A7F5A29